MEQNEINISRFVYDKYHVKTDHLLKRVILYGIVGDSIHIAIRHDILRCGKCYRELHGHIHSESACECHLSDLQYDKKYAGRKKIFSSVIELLHSWNINTLEEFKQYLEYIVFCADLKCSGSKIICETCFNIIAWIDDDIHYTPHAKYGCTHCRGCVTIEDFGLTHLPWPQYNEYVSEVKAIDNKKCMNISARRLSCVKAQHDACVNRLLNIIAFAKSSSQNFEYADALHALSDAATMVLRRSLDPSQIL